MSDDALTPPKPVQTVPVKRTQIRKVHPNRLARVEEMLGTTLDNAALEKQLAIEFGCTRRCVRRYFKIVLDKLHAQRMDNQPRQVDILLATWADLYKRAMEDKQLKVAATVLDRMVRMHGAYAPDKSQIEAIGLIGVASVDPDKVRDRIAELVAKRAMIKAPDGEPDDD